MIKFDENAIAAANISTATNVNVVDGLVQLLNSWEYGLAQEAVCIAELEVLATSEDRDLDRINKTLKWFNVPFRYRKGNATMVGTLTKVNTDSLELLDKDGKTVIIDSARQLVPFELYNAIHNITEVSDKVISY